MKRGTEDGKDALATDVSAGLALIRVLRYHTEDCAFWQSYGEASIP